MSKNTLNELAASFGNLELDKYYELLGLGGVFFMVLAAISQQTPVLKFGVLTFIYSIWAWMMTEGFHITANINLSSPWIERSFVGVIIVQIVSFISYSVAAYSIFN